MKMQTLFYGLLCLLPFSMNAQEKIELDIGEQYQKAVSLLSANQYNKALHYIFECYRSEPENIDYANKLGHCYFQLGNFREAKYTFEAVLKQDSVNMTALNNLAAISNQEHNYNKADFYYQQLSALDSTNSYYYRQRALSQQKQNNKLKATLLFSKAHEYNPKDLATISDLATMYLELKSLDYAHTMINKGMQLDSSNIRILYTNARIQSASEHYLATIRSINSAMSQGDSTAYYQMMLGLSYLRSDSIATAIPVFERIVNWGKASEHTHHYLALAYEIQENPEKSIHHFEKAIEKGISKKVPRYYRDLAELYEKEKKYRKAYEQYRRAYSFEQKEDLLFHIAHNADRYFKDKKIALRYYEQYAKSVDNKFKEYTESRINQLVEIIHQSQ